MVIDQIDPETDLRWQKDFIWVQCVALLQIISSERGALTLRRHDGRELKASEVEMLETHFKIDDGRVLKPKYRPVKAVCLKEDSEIAIDGVSVGAKAGDAVLRMDDGSFEIIPNSEYVLDYQAVAYPGTEQKPATPFPDPQ